MIEYVEYVFVLYTSMSIMFSMHRATTKTRSNPLSRGTMAVDLCQNEVLQQNLKNNRECTHNLLGLRKHACFFYDLHLRSILFAFDLDRFRYRTIRFRERADALLPTSPIFKYELLSLSNMN